MFTVQELWVQFRRDAIPNDWPEEQVRLLELAFYAGALEGLRGAIGVVQNQPGKARSLLVQIREWAVRHYEQSIRPFFRGKTG